MASDKKLLKPSPLTLKALNNLYFASDAPEFFHCHNTFIVWAQEMKLDKNVCFRIICEYFNYYLFVNPQTKLFESISMTLGFKGDVARYKILFGSEINFAFLFDLLNKILRFDSCLHF